MRAAPNPAPAKGVGQKEKQNSGTKPLFLQTPSAVEPSELTQQILHAVTSPTLLLISFLVLILQLVR